MPEFSPDQGLLSQSRHPRSRGSLATRYNAAEAAFPQASPLGIARSTADADDPAGCCSTQLVQAVPPLHFNLGKAFQQSMQVQGIAHRTRL